MSEGVVEPATPNVSSPPTLHHLPEDILRHVASKLSTREWARVAPTCSIFHQLQPSAVTVTTSSWIMSREIPGHISSVLLWTSRHLKAATTLDITMHPAGPGPNRMWKEVCRDVVGTLPTQMLRASLVSDVAGYRRMHAHQRRMLEEQIPSRVGYSPATDLEEFAASLARRMPHLQTLSLFVSACPALPALSQLRHIEIQAIDFSNVNDILQPMTRLQTALLTCMHMEALVPVLDLSQLPCLEHLSLQDVYPENLSIPPACRLDLHGEGRVIQQFVGSGWEQALSQLHTCTCAWTITRKTGLRVSVREALPEVLRAQTSIQNLSLLGRGEIELRTGETSWFDLGTVSNLTALHIKTDRHAHMCIPAAMHLQSLEVYAPCVWLSVEEPFGWANDVVHLRLVYKTFRYMRACDKRDIVLDDSPFWPIGSPLHTESECSLYTTFREVGEGPCITYHSGWQSRLECMVLEGCKFDIGMSAAVSVYNGAVQACSCGICWVCLQPEEEH